MCINYLQFINLDMVSGLCVLRIYSNSSSLDPEQNLNNGLLRFHTEDKPAHNASDLNKNSIR